ncbi:EF-hand domain-containing protein [Bradyrhizobium sp. STM 3562]|uniref:EF-hand domain-containing protein n=1 Tax=Bradyrhizobium sp. STM 3562 TaxID=578924 RepID=UPI00388E8B2F
MYRRVPLLTIPTLILAFGASGAMAQDRMMPAPDQQQVQSHPMGQEGAGPMGGQGGMMREHTMGRGMMGAGMMGHGMMGPPPIMLRIMFALIDTDSDGTISLQEFQAAHERIFKAMDANKDGTLTLEEMQAFMHPQH